MKTKLRASEAAEPDGLKANVIKFLIPANDKILL